jgi:glucokinase
MTEVDKVAKPTLGVDLGGTKVKTALVDAEGHIVADHRQPTDPAQGPDGVIADIVTCVQQCVGDALQEAAALGIGVAGQVAADTGIVRFAPNLNWQDVPLRTALEAALELPVVVANDVRAATWGEWRHGAGQGVADLITLFVGTGIGGGVVSSSKVLAGCSNTAGELGHMTLVVDGRSCHCRNRGCLEAYAGGWAIAERAQEAVRQDPAAGQWLVDLAGAVDNITAAHVSQAYQDGDALARRLVEETGRYLAAGAVGLVNAFNPCRLILGGGVIEGLPVLREIVKREVRACALEAAVAPLEVVKAALGADAPVIGAAVLAREI